MSDIKISQLSQAGALTGREILPIVQDNETLRTTLNQIKSFSAPDISNNIIADANSTTKVPSVNAIKTYADGLLVGLLNDRGNYVPSVSSPGAYPSSGGSGTGGAIEKGDIWFIDGVGYLGTTAVTIGSSVRALVNNPSPTTDSDWDILDAALIQSSLSSVLNAGNVANNTITLTDGSTLSTLSRDSLQFNTNTLINAANYNAYTFNIINNAGSYINGSVDRLKVYDITTTNSTELKYNSLKYNNSTFVGSLETATLTSSQTWTLPNATGTIALTSNVWSAVGNAGTVAGTNFLGTTDAIDFVAKTNNIERLRILSTGQVKLSSLTGTGTRMVITNATGQLSAQAITSPTLQAVTNAGNATTNNIISNGTVSYIAVQNPSDSSGIKLEQVAGESGYLHITKFTGEDGVIDALLLTGSRSYHLPDQDGTFALLSDINGNNFWGVTGNTGTSALTNFIGTTDNIDFITKTNNTERLRVLGSGELIITNLAGSGTRMVVADFTGQLSTQSIVSPTLQLVTSGTSKNLTNGINLQGTGAGDLQTGTSINALGEYAASSNSGNDINAFGYQAAKNNIGSDVNAFGASAAQNNSGDYVIAIGSNASHGNSNGFVVSLGDSAAQNNSGSGVNALNQSAAYNNSGNAVNAFGTSAAYNNSGNDVNAFGSGALENNTGSDVNALGSNAAYQNIGNNVNALGYQAAQNNTGSDINAFGSGAGQSNTLSGMTIFSNASMPSYADYAAASAAITVLLGATAGCTYLYHDQATNSIGAVRL